jgi:uncharacterized damage-inducible protein DinB
MDRDIALLIAVLDEAYDHRSWHGTNLRGSIRGLTHRDAARRPGPGRHNIWENVVHAAYWKYTVRRRLRGEKRGSFALTGSNWFPRPVENSAAAWKADIALLEEEHRALRETVAHLRTADLRRTVGRSDEVTAGFLLRGIAAHDLYHAGQIQLVKRLLRPASRPQP